MGMENENTHVEEGLRRKKGRMIWVDREGENRARRPGWDWERCQCLQKPPLSSAGPEGKSPFTWNRFKEKERKKLGKKERKKKEEKKESWKSPFGLVR